MMINWLFGERCARCGKQRTKGAFEGLPTCKKCQAEIKADREEKRPCPLDGAVMNKEVVLNVVIDRCPSCAGVWLDSGELELVKKGIEAGGGGDFASGFIVGMLVG
jgi:hypothetical protein